MPKSASPRPESIKGSRADRLPLIGGTLCLDFTNTVTGLRENIHEREHLLAYENLVAWALHAGAVPAHDAAHLLARAQEDNAGAARTLHRALMVRDVLHDIFAAVARHGSVQPRLLDGLNAALMDASRHARIESHDGHFHWGWDDLSARLDAPLWPVLSSAADLLTVGKLERVKICPYPHCGWLFIDFSKNRSRRWCEMSVCGNRTKARRHYTRAVQISA